MQLSRFWMFSSENVGTDFISNNKFCVELLGKDLNVLQVFQGGLGTNACLTFITRESSVVPSNFVLTVVRIIHLPACQTPFGFYRSKSVVASAWYPFIYLKTNELDPLLVRFSSTWLLICEHSIYTDIAGTHVTSVIWTLSTLECKDEGNEIYEFVSLLFIRKLLQ